MIRVFATRAWQLTLNYPLTRQKEEQKQSLPPPGGFSHSKLFIVVPVADSSDLGVHICFGFQLGVI